MNKGMRILVWVSLSLLVAACANMGRPEGGARDETPPRYVNSNPKPGAVHFSGNKLTVTFDENIQLEDAFNKVVMSPPSKTPPSVSANAKNLTVQFRDTLLPNTTYTIDFADAIKDLNEGNILDGFALDFSTGDSIDSLRISGMVLQASNLEPAQGMLVGVYSNLADSALTTLPLERIARTNQLGQFTIRNLKPGKYRIFAINDINRDYHWDRSEDIAFYDSLISPTVEHIELTDTLYASNGEDSLVTRPGVRYLPNDILLTWFNIGYKAPYLADYKRLDRRRFSLTFGAPNDSLPGVSIADGAPGAGRSFDQWAQVKTNATLDTLEYWITDPEVLAADSLRLAIRYQKLDSLDQRVWTTDTLRFFFKDPEKKKKNKDKDKEKENEPRFTVDSITGDTTFLPPANMEYLDIRAISSSTQDINKPVIIEMSLPVENLDSAAVRLETLVDTIWTPLTDFALVPDSANLLMRRRLDVAWKPGAQYRLSIDSLAMTSVYDSWNKDFKHAFTVKNIEDYSTLRVTMPGTDSVRMVLQLLNGSDEPSYTAVKAPGSDVVKFSYVDPSTYYLRAFIDSTPNGVWDTGNPVDSIQPEEVYYFAKKLVLRKNWDVEQTWNLNELPVDLQKPAAIKKNKPKPKRGEKQETQEEDDFDDQYTEEYNPFDKTGRNNRSRKSGGNNGMRRNTQY